RWLLRLRGPRDAWCPTRVGFPTIARCLLARSFESSVIIDSLGEMLSRETCARMMEWAAPRAGAQPRPASDTLGGRGQRSRQGDQEEPPIRVSDWPPHRPNGERPHFIS